ncbi:C6 transcription factor (ArcA), putative [Talaromyces stipitatus ATCC 10500]|uniref:C6 transcription factor (ArcA), putative n=1 Tax=Talaromyces stipitatus (strain ATCC 10500 / CBS 375.48 / QM 6759 / NRRL 1006) TaxID=441959 RepID=B8LSX5_TALSN|nr:C6 transcription factor (ArcA), putative [Talaromyces stipitatus ATCC 10500]EED22971.1 C6 transcription factor (ArcA), putative [Talaromyces stipitatus ATCC 10500]
MRDPTQDQSPAPLPVDPRETVQTMDTRIQKPANTSQGPKSRRVRTGCLTCRERHLKCDETLPKCQNCSKSGRICKRGIRLNFIDTQVTAPPYTLAPPLGIRLNFQDESREIASEYVGGFERYPPLDQLDTQMDSEPSTHFEFANPVVNRPALHVSASLLSSFPDAPHPEIQDSMLTEPQYTTNDALHEQNAFLPKMSTNTPTDRSYITTPEGVLLMQVFVEEVALWMDSMDANKHFSEIVPLHALNEPLLLNGIWACGARHLYLVNSSYSEDRAVHYYNTASQILLSHLQNPHRDPVLCATAAVILNVYEVMCESAMQRMNHIAGARALIKECRWNGKSPGIGGACFWVNVCMELLSCLHFNWQMAWDPDTWHMDMETELIPSESLFGSEDIWAHRMVYICAKVANFRATIPQFQGLDPQAHQLRLQQRCHEWDTYKRWCDEWARCIPRSMMPVCYVQPWQTSKSAFPEVWLVKRPAIVGRLFYHLTCVLLSKTHPLESEFSPNLREMQQRHAYDACGIIAHVKDRGVATTSIRTLAIAAECFVTREAQQEVLQIIDKIIKETGWRISFLKTELQAKWGWNTSAPGSNANIMTTATTTTNTPISSIDNGSLPNPTTGSNSNGSTPPGRSRLLSGIINPLMATADFSMANHPYQDHYVAPQDHGLEGYQYTHY